MLNRPSGLVPAPYRVISGYYFTLSEAKLKNFWDSSGRMYVDTTKGVKKVERGGLLSASPKVVNNLMRIVNAFLPILLVMSNCGYHRTKLNINRVEEEVVRLELKADDIVTPIVMGPVANVGEALRCSKKSELYASLYDLFEKHDLFILHPAAVGRISEQYAERHDDFEPNVMSAIRGIERPAITNVCLVVECDMERVKIEVIGNVMELSNHLLLRSEIPKPVPFSFSSPKWTRRRITILNAESADFPVSLSEGVYDRNCSLRLKENYTALGTFDIAYKNKHQAFSIIDLTDSLRHYLDFYDGDAIVDVKCTVARPARSLNWSNIIISGKVVKLSPKQ